MNIQLVVQNQTISGQEKIKGLHLAMQRPLRMILQEVGLFLLHLAHCQSSFGVSVCKLVCPTLFEKFGCEVVQKLPISVSILRIQGQRKNLVLLLIQLVTMIGLFQLMHEHLKERLVRLIPQRSEYLSLHPEVVGSSLYQKNIGAKFTHLYIPIVVLLLAR